MEQSPARSSSVTVADVAREAGVSKATAARVLGGYGTVSAKVREAVKAAAAALDYRPNELARSMTTGRSGTIGVVVGDIENPFFSLAVRGITDVARLAGFNVILSNSGEDVAAEKAAIRTLVAKRVDGIIVSPAKEGDVEHLKDIERSGRPLALLDRSAPSLNVDTVIADDMSGGGRYNQTADRARASPHRLRHPPATRLTTSFIRWTTFTPTPSGAASRGILAPVARHR